MTNDLKAEFHHALSLLKKEQVQPAVAVLEAILQKEPCFLPALKQLATTYLCNGNYDASLQLLHTIIEHEPTHAESMHHIAHAYMFLNQTEKAVQYYEQTLILNHNHQEAHHYLANAYLKLNDPIKALTYFLRQLEINPMSESYYNIGVIFMHQGRLSEAVLYFREAQTKDPNYLPTYLNLGSIYLKQQHLDLAISTYKAALSLDPDNKEITYILQALTSAESFPERAPDEYIQNLFNEYAPYYDKHLNEILKYQVPQQLERMLLSATDEPLLNWRILDLGCGTGLAGAQFKSYASELIGIDLSETMLAAARTKCIYDQLILENIAKALPSFSAIDLILAADVFSYFGDLNHLFCLCQEALAPFGRLLFSIEKITDPKTPYRLQNNMRYTHSVDYIKSVAQENQLAVEHHEQMILREQQKKPVLGYLFLLKSIS